MTDPSNELADANKMMRYDANKKSMLVAYILLFFLGMLGAHRFYLGETKTGLIMLALFVGGSALSVVGIGMLGVAAVGVWVVVDLFLIPSIVSKRNNELIEQLS